MQNYKNYLHGFFKFYSNFNYSDLVMSTFKGRAIEALEYKSLFPNFQLEGIFIVGPFNQGKNSGVVDNEDKLKFIELCKASAAFLDR